MLEIKNKKHTLRFRAVNRGTWENIKSGEKTVETRAATVKYRDIKAGDVLVLICGKDRFSKKIKRAVIFKNIPTLLKKYKVKNIMPEARSAKDLEAAYYSYPGYREKIKKFGIIAMELK